MTALRAAPEASSMHPDQMTALQSASGQISHAPEDQPTTARKKRAGQTDLLITTVIQNHAVLIQEASVSQLPALTVHGNLVHQELTDHLLTDLTQSETHLTAVQEATTAQTVHRIAPHVRTLTVLGNLVHQELTDHLLTDLTQSETHLTAVQEATTAQTVHRIAPHVLPLTVLGNLVHQELTDHLLTDLTQTDHQEPEATTDQIVQHDQTLTVHGNHVHQELIAQSAQVIHVDLRLVQTLASLTATATRSVRTAYHAIAQEMKHLLALATRTQTRRHSSRTRF
jgi:hypothetical protein